MEEKQEICDNMFAAGQAIDGTMRANFEQLPPELLVKLLDTLCESGCIVPTSGRRS